MSFFTKKFKKQQDEVDGSVGCKPRDEAGFLSRSGSDGLEGRKDENQD